MDDQLVDMDVSGVVNGDRLKEEAREALANFKDVPTQKNLETAINSLEKLRDSDLGRSEIQKLDGQLNSLRSLNDPMLNVAAKIPGGIDGIENVISDPAHIAGITNERGNVLGMMPHPERAVEAILGSVDGLRLFKSLLENGKVRTEA